MPWIYHQKTGGLHHDKKLVGIGWSGHGPGKNTPALQNLPKMGPIPRGTYTIGQPFDYHSTKTHHGTGPYSMRLTPDKGNTMFGRDGFLIHGPSMDPKRYGQESDGCVILTPALRHSIGSSTDHVLEVVE